MTNEEIKIKLAAVNGVLATCTDVTLIGAYKALKSRYEAMLNNAQNVVNKIEAGMNEPEETQEFGCSKCGKFSKSKAGNAAHERKCQKDSLTLKDDAKAIS